MLPTLLGDRASNEARRGVDFFLFSFFSFLLQFAGLRGASADHHGINCDAPLAHSATIMRSPARASLGAIWVRAKVTRPKYISVEALVGALVLQVKSHGVQDGGRG
ncbi:hypothetical protein NDU88_007645, partial [Pleurodeles waltl]